MLVCPNCRRKVYVSVITDELHDECLVYYRCNYCNLKLSEDEVIEDDEKTKDELE